MVKNVLKFYLLFLPLLSFGQSPQEIESAEFIVEKDKDLKLPKRQRLFEHVKSSPTSAGFDSLTFVLKEIPFEIRSYHPNLKVEKLENPAEENLYDHLINMGYGSYNTPGILYEYSTHRLTSPNYGIRIDLKKHQKGPIQDNYSGESTSEVKLWHTMNLNKGILSTSLDYGYDKFYNYGMLDDLSALSSFSDTADHYLRRQHRFNLHFDYLLKTKGESNIHIKPEWHYTGQQGFGKIDEVTSYYSGGNENDFVLNFNLDALKRKSWMFDFDFFMALTQFNNKRSENNQRIWAYGIPKINLTFNEWSVSAGFKIGFYDDAAGGGSGFLLPDVAVSYTFGNHISIYGEVKGQVIRNDFNSVVSQNRYVSDSITLNTSIEKIGLKLGMSGGLLPRMTYHINLSIKSIDDQLYFTNNKMDPSYFDVVYDVGNSSRFDSESYLNFDVANDVSLFAVFTFNQIKTSTIKTPWHTPSTSFQMGAKLGLIEDKLFLSPYFIHLSNIKAWSKADEIIVLPNILDFGIDINMLFNYKIGAFLKIRNLLGKENQRYNLYSSREFDIYGGISVRF
ncbi:hypothetical protein N8385_01855 [Cyclobacteriaceae bacterium]|jgi:hypothetical protein|nr:hypothetical protein [Cyclobacteriaceae bacterium]